MILPVLVVDVILVAWVKIFGSLVLAFALKTLAPNFPTKAKTPLSMTNAHLGLPSHEELVELAARIRAGEDEREIFPLDNDSQCYDSPRSVSLADLDALIAESKASDDFIMATSAPKIEDDEE